MDMWDFRMFLQECIKHGQYEELVKILREENIIQPEVRPQGEWVKDEYHSITINIFKCSNCGGGGYPIFKYCPHCGALMIKEEKNESRS